MLLKVLPTYAQSDAENEGEVGGDGHDVPRAERELLSLGDRHICRSSGRSGTRSTDEWIMRSVTKKTKCLDSWHMCTAQPVSALFHMW